MNLRNFIYLDGEVVDGNKPIFMVANSMFQRNDGTHEDLLAFGTEAKHLTLHIEHLKNALKTLDIEIPFILLTETNVAETITRLLNKNRFFNNAWVRITVFRGAVQSEPSICIETHDFSTKKYQYNSNGLHIDVFDSIKKPIDILSGVSGSDKMLLIKARRFVEENKLDNCLIVNANGRIADAIDANVFIVRGNKIYTPSLAEGCCPNIMRNLICEIAPTIGIDIDNQVGLTINAALSARELFIANPIYGIRWVLGFKQQRYYNEISKALHEIVCKRTFG